MWGLDVWTVEGCSCWLNVNDQRLVYTMHDTFYATYDWHLEYSAFRFDGGRFHVAFKRDSDKYIMRKKVESLWKSDQ